MMNFRFREKVNTWPAFVDLFSNLVIILIFLLIVFVFLWTTTSVFNKDSGAKTVADLRKTNEEQAQKIVQMTAYEEEAKRLLVLARNELESSSAVVAKYQAQIAELESGSADLQNQIAELTTQLNQATLDKQRASELEQERRTLQEQMNQQRAELAAQLNKLQAALNAAEEEAHQKDIQYVEMSNRLNKALADKVAELNDVAKYQSAFYKSIKDALGDGSFIQPEGDRFIVSSDILFGSGSYTLSPEGKNQLRLIANVINDLENKIPTNIDWIIRVDGHTDRQAVVPGTRGYSNNMELSLLRANAVVDELARANGLVAPYGLYIGQKLTIPSKSEVPFVQTVTVPTQAAGAQTNTTTRVELREITVVAGDTLYSLSRRYSVPVNDLAVMNNLTAPFTLSVGQKLKVPDLSAAPVRAAATSGATTTTATTSATGTSTAHAQPKQKISSDPTQKLPKISARSSSKFSWPVRGKVLSLYGAKSGGLFNDGINIGAARGTKVGAAENGVVAYAGNEVKGMGNLIIIQHSGGWMTVYAHLDTMSVRRGAKVSVGQKIGTVGATGKVDVPQLHFEIRKGTKAYNPSSYLK